MKRLIETQLFRMLQKGTINPAETDIAPLYDDFVQSALSICTCAKGDVPVHFTLHYTRLELEAFQSEQSTKGAGEKWADAKLHRPMPCLYRRCPAMGRQVYA